MFSPRPKRSKGLAKPKDRTNKTQVREIKTHIQTPSGAWMAPISQLMTTCKLTVSEDRVIIRKDLREVKMALTATPASNRVELSRLPEALARLKTKKAAAKAPIKEKRGRIISWDKGQGKRSARVAPTAAPPEEPTSQGSARGFLKIP
jgi:hypothetical protein